jgi:atlastin
MIRSEQIVKITGTQFEFNSEKFNNIISSSEIDPALDVCVIVINGPLRTGKSFFSNFIVRELLRKVNNDNDICLNNCFRWRRGSNVETLGIWMLNKVFVINDKAIILLDTQGIFDNELNQRMTIALLSLSTIISSFQIYNIDKRIQEDNLQYLAYFSEYSKLISNNGFDGKIGQKISILVRDWQNYSDVEDMFACKIEREDYKEKFLSQKLALDCEKITTREKINECYDDIDCYLLPHPGYRVTEKVFTGDINEIRTCFVKHTENYIDIMLDEIRPRKVGNGNLTLGSISLYIKKYVDLYHNIKDNLPEPRTILETTEIACLDNAKITTLNIYRKSMKKNIAGRYLSKNEILDLHSNAANKAMEHFDGLLLMGHKKKIHDTRNHIEDEIHRESEVYEKLSVDSPFLRLIQDAFFSLVNGLGILKILVIIMWYMSYNESGVMGSSIFFTKAFYILIGIIISRIINY